ncbi:hypothetical protein J5226_19395 [Lysobacter sp. K5869]|uniref:hypothetical protein n=1 Tax=Lysobacter sp. K5869 TaxID=2820808 RepID=UPI001C060B94|nr:hypothetical protein [Lysobacter sp. K5869]QWP75752.1 hypothetical protein J5226_19395 [Lysobacter sp. K5869]
MKAPLLLAVLACALSPLAAFADDAALEKGLTEAMRYDRAKGERAAPSGPALQAYIQAGYFDLKPNVRADYTDYRVLKKPAPFMGQSLVLVEEEYMTQYVGCCVDEGVSAVVRVSGSTAAMEKFAKANACTFEPKYDPVEALSDRHLGVSLPAGRYAKLSCHENDVNR